MICSYHLDLTRYSDDEVAMLMVEGVITRSEFEEWRADKHSAIKIEFPDPAAIAKSAAARG